MTKYLPALIVLALLAAFVYGNRSKEHARSESNVDSRESQIVALEQQVLAKLEQDHKATVKWSSDLISSASYRSEPVLSLELEEVWLGRPIVFVGHILDLGVSDQRHYEVWLVHSDFDELMVPEATMSVKLVGEKELLDAFLSKNRTQLIQDRGYARYAVAARIHSIDSGLIPTSEGELRFGRIGRGVLLDIAAMTPRAPVDERPPDSPNK